MLRHVRCWHEATHTVPVTSHISHAYRPSGACSTQAEGTEKVVVVFEPHSLLSVVQTHFSSDSNSQVHANF